MRIEDALWGDTVRGWKRPRKGSIQVPIAGESVFKVQMIGSHSEELQSVDLRESQ